VCRTGLSVTIMGMSAPGLAALLPSWELNLRAERKSPATITDCTVVSEA
jgi:hypothetical protein